MGSFRQPGTPPRNNGRASGDGRERVVHGVGQRGVPVCRGERPGGDAQVAKDVGDLGAGEAAEAFVVVPVGSGVDGGVEFGAVDEVVAGAGVGVQDADEGDVVLGSDVLAAECQGGVVVAECVGDGAVDEDDVGADAGGDLVADAAGDDPEGGVEGVAGEDGQPGVPGGGGQVGDQPDPQAALAECGGQLGEEGGLAGAVGPGRRRW